MKVLRFLTLILVVLGVSFAPAYAADEHSPQVAVPIARAVGLGHEALEALGALIRESPDPRIRGLGLKLESEVQSDGIFDIPPEDRPTIWVFTDGTGDAQANVVAPAPPQYPVLFFVKRVGCPGGCPEILAGAAWTQSALPVELPPRVQWYRPIESDEPDILSGASVGGFEKPGEYELRVAVFYRPLNNFVTETFSVTVEPLEFFLRVCAEGETVMVNFFLQAPQKFLPTLDGELIPVQIGEETFVGVLSTLEENSREAKLGFTMPLADYLQLEENELPVTITVDGDRTRTKGVFFYHPSACGEKG